MLFKSASVLSCLRATLLLDALSLKTLCFRGARRTQAFADVLARSHSTSRFVVGPITVKVRDRP